jgi:hypothetical protein
MKAFLPCFGKRAVVSEGQSLEKQLFAALKCVQAKVESKFLEKCVLNTSKWRVN